MPYIHEPCICRHLGHCSLSESSCWRRVEATTVSATTPLEQPSRPTPTACTPPTTRASRRRPRWTTRSTPSSPTRPTRPSQTAKDAWLAARDDYGPTEAFRFYDGPIDNADDGPEGLINAWPMDEAYVDYVEGDPDAGIVNDPDDVPEITADVLVERQRGGWRDQHLDRLARHRVPALGPGPERRRPRRAPGHRLHRRTPNAERRATYLADGHRPAASTTSSGLADAWDPDAGGNYRDEFLAPTRRGRDQHHHRASASSAAVSSPASG